MKLYFLHINIRDHLIPSLLAPNAQSFIINLKEFPVYQSGEDFQRLFTIFVHGGHFGHMIETFQTNLRFPEQYSLHREILLKSAESLIRKSAAVLKRSCLKLLTTTNEKL